MTEEDKKFLAESGLTIVVSLSGGKDSTAVCLWLREQGIAHHRVFADTGWEHPAVYEQIEYLEEVLGPIVRVGYPGGMEALVKKKGMFPSRLGRFCTEKLKVLPIAEYLDSLDLEPINVVGVRAGESKARSQMPRWEWQGKPFDCWVWRPLIDWTEENVIEIHRRNAVKPCRLYLDHNVQRVGCWPCIFARKAEIATIANIDPATIDRLEALEREVQELARVRYAKRGETFASKGHTPPTWFQVYDRKQRRQRMAPIREIVDWARTGKGRKQKAFDFFQAPADQGCVRWGMCETPEDND